MRPGIRNVSTVKPSMGRCRPQSSISATARSMWPLATQFASKPGDFAGISMYRVSVGSTSSCHFFWTKVRVSWGGSGLVDVGLMDGTVAPRPSGAQPEVTTPVWTRGGRRCDPRACHTDQPAEQQIARLTLLAEARYLPAALAVVREAGAAVGLAAADVIGLDRAVDQVASNVIEHGFEPGQSGDLRPGGAAPAGAARGGRRRRRAALRLQRPGGGPGLDPGRAVAGGVRGCDPLLEPRGSGQSSGDRQAPAVHADRRARRRPARRPPRRARLSPRPHP